MINTRHKPQLPVPAANKAKGVTKVEHLAQQLFIHNDMSPEQAIEAAHEFYDQIEGANQEENNDSTE